MKCSFPGCCLKDEHDGEHDLTRKDRIIESGKIVFAVLGAGGYAGCLAGMHAVLGVFSLCLVAGTWYGLYRITEVV